MARSALFLSPHLDDAAFSCGGTLLRLVQEGWRVTLCTIFTASVPHPRGFALACQTDKGLPPEIDYMALRRAEDERFARLAAVDRLVHLPFREAPHRGYESAPALFAGMHEQDTIWRGLIPALSPLVSTHELLFAPQGIGNHVDHLQLIRAVVAAGFVSHTYWYRDTPYAIRFPDAPPSALLPVNLTECTFSIQENLAQKMDGCAVYTTQLPFQFGGENTLRDSLTRFHRAEAIHAGLPEAAAERFLTFLDGK